MISAIKDRLHDLQRRLTARFGKDISTPDARRAAWWHFQLMDHAFLRIFWTNLHQVAPGVWRSNQPSPGRLRRWHVKLGLRSVLNLRGESSQGFYLFEEEACRETGMALYNLQLYAKQPPSREKLKQLLDLFQTIPKPMLFHCKSGADRTGLAAALYLLTIENCPIAEAQRQLSRRYLHVENSRAGIQDHLLRLYARAFADTGISFRDWLHSGYDPAVVSASFLRWQAGDRSLA
ncbi:MAG: tyrosine-protein phosphatase [Paracoccaceae bacterium]